MSTMLLSRLSYVESCQFLQQIYLLDEGAIPPLPAQSPRYDDVTLAVSFFRTLLDDVKLENLTLPRTFFGRSEIRQVSFKNTDLSESVACGNDFIEVDFELADLSGTDLRASIFQHVNFQGADLTKADMRGPDFRSCNFKDANLTGTKLLIEPRWLFLLTSSQIDSVDWHYSRGPDPGGI